MFGELRNREIALPGRAFVAAAVVEHQRQLAGIGVQNAFAALGDDHDDLSGAVALQEHVTQFLAVDFLGIQHRLPRIGRDEPAGLEESQVHAGVGLEPDLLDFPTRVGGLEQGKPGHECGKRNRDHADGTQEARGTDTAG